VSWNAQRLDVFAVDPDGSINHWGWKGDTRYWDDPQHEEGIPPHSGTWFPDPGSIGDPDGRGPFVYEPIVLSTTGTDFRDLYAVRADSTMEHWIWDGRLGMAPVNRWEQQQPVGQVLSKPVLIGEGGTLKIFAWGNESRLDSWELQYDGSWYPGSNELQWPVTAETPSAQTVVDTRAPDYLLRRPEDLVVLGLSWSGLAAGAVPGVLRPTGDKLRLLLTFPPQHIGEEVNATAELAPGGDVAGSAIWRARLAGPSRLALEPAAADVPFTVYGVLKAAATGSVVPWALDPTQAFAEDPATTAIELPSQLTFSPTAGAVVTHTADPWVEDDVVSLWRTTFAAGQHPLELRAHRYGDSDSFAVALPLSSRQLIVAQSEPAVLQRLELSALGGSLVVKGLWESLEWEHTALLGRDMVVRTLQRGILYPFGHRAEYVEVTDRTVDPAGAEAIAVLRKQRFLRITEPVRGRSAQPRLARVFPFDSVEFAEQIFTGLDDPDAPDSEYKWERYPRLPLVPTGLADDLRRLEETEVPMPPGHWVGFSPIAEDLTTAVEDVEAGADLELAAEQAANAEERIKRIEQLTALRDQIQAIEKARTVATPWFFTPSRGGTPVRFAVRCGTGGQEISVELPVVFAADAQYDETPTMTAFDTLADGQVATKLANAFAKAGGGVVTLPGRSLDLVGSAQPLAGDTLVVKGLNIVGVRDGRGFRPRLGPPPAPDDVGAQPGYAAEWAIEADLPEMRTLLPGLPATHGTRLVFSRDFAERGDQERVPFRTLAEQAVGIDFSKNADRSGGLISPVIDATGLSRDNGLVNADGLLSMDPTQLVEADATLLGIGLQSLLAGVTSAPIIISDLSAGGMPVVKMLWEKVPLHADGAPLGSVEGWDQPAMTLSVVSGENTETTCTVTDFALTFPKTTPLLSLRFRTVRFRQLNDQPPVLEIEGLDAEFLGALDLLKGLQEKVGLGDALPQLQVTGDAIVARYALPVPDVAVAAFVMRNLTFSAAVTVPFRGEAVSVALGFASRERPFNLSVLMFGGGGYVDLAFAGGDISRLEICLEFGAAVAVSFVIASGEAHVLGGIRYELVNHGTPAAPRLEARLTGYLRIGGSLQILGLVSMSVELMLELGYQTTGNRLVGRATLVLELDLTLWSDTVELDSGEWVISGDDPPAAPQPAVAEARAKTTPDHLEDVRNYRKAYSR
jgi:hypothetical protein